METQDKRVHSLTGLLTMALISIAAALAVGLFAGTAWAADAPAAAYAVYYTDRSLVFQTDEEPYEGKTIDTVYEVDIEGTESPAWSPIASRVTSVTVAEWMYTHSTAGWFKDFSSCTSFDLEYLVTNNCTDMSNMFAGAEKVERISLLNQRTANVTSMESMFEGCALLKYVLMPNVNTSKVTSFKNMFKGCENLYMLDLSLFNNSAATDSTDMLSGLTRLRGIKLGSSFDLQTDSAKDACGLGQPTSESVYHADGNWYDKDGKAYKSTVIPSKTAQTYTAYKTGTVYEDVPFADWYAPLVTTASEMGYVGGIGATVGQGALFSPYGQLSRCELAQILANMAGVDLNEYANVSPFTDVDENDWFAPAVAWAKEQKITLGYANGDTFRPYDTVYRAEYAVFLARYAEMMGDVTLTGYDTDILDEYKDGDQVVYWAREAVAWAVDNKIMGMTTGTARLENIYPNNPIARCEAATMVVRYQPYFLIGGVKQSVLDVPTGEIAPVKPEEPDDGSGDDSGDNEGTGGSGSGDDEDTESGSGTGSGSSGDTDDSGTGGDASGSGGAGDAAGGGAGL